MRPVFSFLVAAACAVTVFGIIIVSDWSSPTTSFIEKDILKQYKYNTICDIANNEEGFQGELIRVHSEIMTGQHNDNPKLAEFLKTKPPFDVLGITPDQIFSEEENIFNGQNKVSGRLAPNYDPIFYDLGFWLPVSLDILGMSPELVDFLTLEGSKSQNEWSDNLRAELEKCKK